MSNGSPLGALLPFVIILGAFWLLILRPQRARMRQAQETQGRLAVGSEVITTAGLYGRVVGLDDDSVTLEVAPGVTNRFVRAAVGRVVSGSEGSTAVPPEDEIEPPDESGRPPSP